jgi:hypothetical protein
MQKWGLVLVVVLVIAGCAPSEPEALPTVAMLPTETFTPVASATPELSATPTPTATNTFTATPIPTFTDNPTLTPSNTPTQTFTPTQTNTPTNTPTPLPPTANPTAFAIASATAIVIERPVFATFTPAPIGEVARPTSTGTPQIIADVIISEAQFQEEVTRLLTGKTDVADAEIDFTPQGVNVTLTALGGQAFTTGSFFVYFQMSEQGFDNFVVASADSSDLFVMNGGGLPSEAFVNSAYGTVVPAVFEAFNFILNQRLGEGKHDLDNLVIDDSQMYISLLVVRP